ncbi:MAG: hypothetical protein JSU94_05980 [Phycisphaerales bacterium]|nr:MAG: hypothetical protein JSU94_05980 [Phycisphaerales bacterium]
MVARRLDTITPKPPFYKRCCMEDVFYPGRLTNLGEAVLSTGGAASNTGPAVAKLGVDAVLSGQVDNWQFTADFLEDRMEVRNPVG